MQSALTRQGYAPFGACAPSRACRRRAVVRAALDEPSSLIGAAAAVPLLAAGGVAAWKFTTYGQLEYITASMLTNHVPKRDPRVIQLYGGTRELYYYPKSTVQVTVVGEGINKSLLEQAGMQAAMPTLARPQSPANLGFAGDASIDAVVSLGALGRMSEVQRQAFLGEALRVLRPGAPIIFVERLPGGLPFRSIGGSSGTISESLLNGWKARTDAFELVQWDVALEGQDPHAVGVAVKGQAYRPGAGAGASSEERRAEREAREARERAEREAKKEKARLKKDKGFDKAAGKA